MTDPFAVPPEAQAPAAGPSGGSSRALLVLAVVGALLVLTVVGAAGALLLGGALRGEEVAAPPTGEPLPSVSPEPSTGVLLEEPTGLPTTPLPTADLQARNLFRPLVGVDDAAGEATGTLAGGTSAGTAGGTTSGTTGGTTSGGTTLGLTDTTGTGGGGTIYVPGPTETVTGPTVTATATATRTTTATATATTTTSVSPYTYDVTVLSVADPGLDDSDATLEINDETFVLSTGEVAEAVFTYTSFDSGTGLVSFTFGSTMYDVPVGTELGLG